MYMLSTCTCIYKIPCDKVPDMIHYDVFYSFSYTYPYLSVYMLVEHFFLFVVFFVFIFNRINVTVYSNQKKVF